MGDQVVHYAASAVLAVCWLGACVGAGLVILEGGYRVAEFYRRGRHRG